MGTARRIQNRDQPLHVTLLVNFEKYSNEIPRRDTYTRKKSTYYIAI